MLDYKPKLEALNGKPMPPSLTHGQRLAQIRGKELIVVNFDMVTGPDKLNTGHDDPQTISVIPLEK